MSKSASFHPWTKSASFHPWTNNLLALFRNTSSWHWEASLGLVFPKVSLNCRKWRMHVMARSKNAYHRSHNHIAINKRVQICVAYSDLFRRPVMYFCSDSISLWSCRKCMPSCVELNAYEHKNHELNLKPMAAALCPPLNQLALVIDLPHFPNY